MVTARVIVTTALDMIGIHPAEEPLTAYQEQQGLQGLNDLIASCSLEQFFLYYTPPQSLSWPVGKQVLTWGLGGDISSPRPLQIGHYAEVEVPPAGYEWPVAVLAQEHYAAIPDKQMQSAPIQAVYYAPDLPLGQLYAWPVPSQPQELTVYPWQVLRSWPAFDDDVLLPPGYDRFLKPALAVELAPFYDKVASETILAIRAEAKGAIKTVNVQVPTLQVPPFADPWMQQGSPLDIYADVRFR